MFVALTRRRRDDTGLIPVKQLLAVGEAAAGLDQFGGVRGRGVHQPQLLLARRSVVPALLGKVAAQEEEDEAVGVPEAEATAEGGAPIPTFIY